MIRSCLPEEIEAVVKLLIQTGLYLDYMDNPERLSVKLKFDPDSILVAVSDKTIVGITITVYDSWVSFVFHVAVDADHRRIGIGKALVGEAVRRLEAKGTGEVAAYIVESNDWSRSMFRGLGWDEYPHSVIAVGVK